MESDAQKQMAKYGFEHKFHNLKYFEDWFFSVILEFTMNLRASLQKIEKNKNCKNLSYIRQNLDNYLFNITHLHTTCIVF